MADPDLFNGVGLQQKVALLSGQTFWRLPAEPALGLREIVMSDGPVGVRGQAWDERDTSLTIPSPTSLAASWDPALVSELGKLLAAEARRKQVDVLLAPTLNIHRSPLAGRHFECFSEDPLLTATIGVAYLLGVQSQGVAATAKHFVANDAETQRRTVDNRVDERTLREVYLRPFEAAVDAGVWAVMSAYNGLNGHPMTESPLLTDPLKWEWAFDGVVISDWYAIYDTVRSARAEQDVEMPGPASRWGDALVAAVGRGDVTQAAIDAKVARVLRLASRVGATETTAPLPAHPPERPRDLIRRAAAAGSVLVRNDGVLPLAAGPLHRLAVLGPNAAAARIQGGGSASVYPGEVVSPLAGLVAALGDQTEVVHTPGAYVSNSPEPLSLDNAVHPASGRPGVEVSFLGADGTVLRSEHRHSGQLLWVADDSLAEVSAVEVRALVHIPVCGVWTFAVGGVGRYCLDVEGTRVLDTELAVAETDVAAGLFDPPYASWQTELDAGSRVQVVARHTRGNPGEDHVIISVGVLAPRRSAEDELTAAVHLAAGSDAAVVVVGTTSADESEGFDRASLALPGTQDELVRRVAEVNPRTVVVVNSGAPVLLPWRDAVGAVLLVWFPGQQAGEALADVLLGRVEPTGRLPTTWPARQDDGPVLSTTPADGRLEYREGIHIGYRAWLRAGAEPAYWFGHGMGYTTWSLTTAQRCARGVRATIRNTGDRRGRQVVQVYLSRPDSAVDRPVRWLAGFAAAELDPGEERGLDIELPDRAFAHWDDDWCLEPGQFTAEIGFSAVNLAWSLTITR